MDKIRDESDEEEELRVDPKLTRWETSAAGRAAKLKHAGEMRAQWKLQGRGTSQWRVRRMEEEEKMEWKTAR